MRLRLINIALTFCGKLGSNSKKNYPKEQYHNEMVKQLAMSLQYQADVSENNDEFETIKPIYLELYEAQCKLLIDKMYTQKIDDGTIRKYFLYLDTEEDRLKSR